MEWDVVVEIVPVDVEVGLELSFAADVVVVIGLALFLCFVTARDVLILEVEEDAGDVPVRWCDNSGNTVARSFRLYSPNVNTFHALRDIRSVNNWKYCKCNVSYVRRRCPRIILLSRIHFIISAREYPASRNNSSRILTGRIISRPNRRRLRFSSYSSNGTVHSDSCFHPIDTGGPHDDAGLSPLDRG